MSLSLAKKSLSLIDGTSTSSAKTKKSKKKHKNAFKHNHKQESLADSRTDEIVQRLLSYNSTSLDENVAKKVSVTKISCFYDAVVDTFIACFSPTVDFEKHHEESAEEIP